MADHDPFNLDMFGSSQNALSSGLGFGVTAFIENPVIEPDETARPTATAPVKRSKSWQLTERQSSEATERGSNFRLLGSRALAKGWKARARDNLEAIRLATAIAVEDRPASREEQARLIRFTGFGASDLANAIFTRRGGDGLYWLGRPWRGLAGGGERRRLRLACPLHAICAFHARVYRPGDVEGTGTPWLARRTRA